jgi:hypothetical protein
MRNQQLPVPDEFHVQAGADAVGDARRRIVVAARRWSVPLSPSALADVELCASEIITNALTHAGDECWPLLNDRSGSAGRCRPSRLDGLDDKTHDILRSLVLPETQNDPAVRAQMFGCPSVSLHVPIKLCSPPLGIRLWARCVHRTAVPEATIEEDCYLQPAEGHVYGTTRHVRDAHVEPVAKPLVVKQVSNSQLLSCVTGRLPAHARCDGRRRRCWGHNSILPPAIRDPGTLAV